MDLKRQKGLFHNRSEQTSEHRSNTVYKAALLIEPIAQQKRNRVKSQEG